LGEQSTALASIVPSVVDIVVFLGVQPSFAMPRPSAAIEIKSVPRPVDVWASVGCLTVYISLPLVIF